MRLSKSLIIASKDFKVFMKKKNIIYSCIMKNIIYSSIIVVPLPVSLIFTHVMVLHSDLHPRAS